MACLDIDERLCDATRQAAARHHWRLRVSPVNLLDSQLPAEMSNPFDAVVSASVLEHLPKDRQADAVSRLAALVRPGGLFVLTLDFGADAPQPGALRSVEEVQRLVAASGLEWIDGQEFRDTGLRFALDRRYPERKFTFGAVFLQKRA